MLISSALTFTIKTFWMKYILKKTANEPLLLADYRNNTPNAAYDGLGGEIKQELRKELAQEQGFICAYCMARIEQTKEKMDIEHYITQRRHANSLHDEQTHHTNQLNYLNMLGTCRQPRCCSGIRGNTPLTINPMDNSCERLIQFRQDGGAFSTDARIQADIDMTLKLNDQTLKDNRCTVIDIARGRLKSKYPKGGWSNNLLDQEIADWLSLKNTRYGSAYQEYCMAAVYYLRSKKR